MYFKKKPKKFIVVEKDKKLAEEIEQKFSKQLTVINKDILEIDENTLSKEKFTVFEIFHIIFLQKFYVNGF